jgi:hypothetical protein
MKANQKFRLGYIDAEKALKLMNRAPGKMNLEKLFRVKGEDYKKGFLKRLESIGKETSEA